MERLKLGANDVAQQTFGQRRSASSAGRREVCETCGRSRRHDAMPVPTYFTKKSLAKRVLLGARKAVCERGACTVGDVDRRKTSDWMTFVCKSKLENYIVPPFPPPRILFPSTTPSGDWMNPVYIKKTAGQLAPAARECYRGAIGRFRRGAGGPPPSSEAGFC